MTVNKWVIKQGMQMILRISAFFARRTAFAGISDALMRGLARGTVHNKRIQSASNLQELGDAWQRGFPSRKQVPIESVTSDTVFAQIHTPCPLAGTGDLVACHRMMEYDREVVRRAGGQFVVLQSQATPGIKHCRVAMRMQSQRIDDLKHAHL
jgi:hypothetical protein